MQRPDRHRLASARPRLTAIGVVTLCSLGHGAPAPAAPGSPADVPLPLQGAFNLRDLGGHRVADGARIRFGAVYRSDALSRLTDADLRRVAELNLRTVVDFRIDEERKLGGADRLPEDRDIRRISLPINPADPAGYVEKLLAGEVESADEAAAYMKALYATLALDHAPQYRSLLKAVLDSDGEPLLFHCTAGKDRAGLAAAFLLRLLGAPMSAIEANYLASPPARLPEGIDILDGIGPALIEPMLGVDVEYLREAFAAIDRAYGSFEAYAATALGIGPQERRRLARLLTEPEGGTRSGPGSTE